MFDVDYFKKFNDIYGYDMGDDVLRLVVFWLCEINGKVWVYCYGGEEFLIIYKGKLVKEVLFFIEVLW